MVYELFPNQALLDCPHSSTPKELPMFPNLLIHRLCSLNLLVRILSPHVLFPMASPHKPPQWVDLAANNFLLACLNRFRAPSFLLHPGPFMEIHLSDYLYNICELCLHIPNCTPNTVSKTPAQIQNLVAQARSQKKKVEARLDAGSPNRVDRGNW